MGQPHLKTNPSLHWRMNPLSEKWYLEENPNIKKWCFNYKCENVKITMLYFFSYLLLAAPKQNLGHYCGKCLTHQMLLFIDLNFTCSLVRSPSWELPYAYQSNFGEPPPMGGIIPVGNPVLSMPVGNPVEYTANISIIIALRQDKWSLKKKKKWDHKLFYFNHSTIL